MNTSTDSTIQPTSSDIAFVATLFPIPDAVNKIAVYVDQRCRAVIDESETELRILRAEREECNVALGFHPDAITDIPAEIRRLRDEAREWFHTYTRRIEEREQLESLNLEVAREAEEERERGNEEGLS